MQVPSAGPITQAGLTAVAKSGLVGVPAQLAAGAHAQTMANVMASGVPPEQAQTRADAIVALEAKFPKPDPATLAAKSLSAPAESAGAVSTAPTSTQQAFNQALSNGLARGLPMQTALARALNVASSTTFASAKDGSTLSALAGGGTFSTAGPQSSTGASEVAMVNALARGESPQQAQVRAERMQAVQSMAERAARTDAADPMRVLSNGHQAILIQSVGPVGGSALAAALARGDSMTLAMAAATRAQDMARKAQIAAQLDRTDPVRAMSNGYYSAVGQTATAFERQVMTQVFVSGQNPALAIQIASKMTEIERRFTLAIERGMTPTKQLAAGALATTSLSAPALDQAFARGLPPDRAVLVAKTQAQTPKISDKARQAETFASDPAQVPAIQVGMKNPVFIQAFNAALNRGESLEHALANAQRVLQSNHQTSAGR